jgi:creatinine amidohydrolase
MKEVRLFKLTWPEVEEHLKKNDTVIIPTGSHEQHGRHVALDNDAFTAFEISRRVAERTGVLVAPPIPVGYSPHHMDFPGSITLTFETLVNVYKEVCLSLFHHGFKKIAIFNGHGGNRNPIAQALREIRLETGNIVYATLVYPTGTGFAVEAFKKHIETPGGHAGEMETSVGLHLGQRILFDEGKKGELPPDANEILKKYIVTGKVVIARNMADVSVSGSRGDPSYATEEKGKKIVEPLIEELVEFIEDLKAL